MQRLIPSVEHHLASFLCDICPVPAAVDYYRAQDWPAHSSGGYYDPVGWVHDWDGVCPDVGGDGGVEGAVGGFGGWFVLFSMLPSRLAVGNETAD